MAKHGKKFTAAAAQVQDRLFEPFVSTKQQGTGLGLYVVGRHIREIGGEIHCETEAGKGTRFIVRLPKDGADSASSSQP